MNAFRGVFGDPENRGVESLSAGEEEVKVAKSEASATTGAWCKKESPRWMSGAIRERSSAWTSSSRAARQRCPSGSASTWPRS
ncbi:hypothetical protein EST54_24985 [Streptomyces sioyaensis]|uniref:Uncharacterized protein n=1 Tax=Streptomyces sioyaensis TaxID=67364 RepID=A0A4Q1QVG2_9ACTN|nr:hypothetical protein EST54_24985 [Streptomyces sioyaensis]RXS88796.1 hypothetical protein EST92_00545 [Streptomyces sp. TM32]